MGAPDNTVPISKLADKYGIHPNALYKWKKQLFKQAPQNLVRKTRKNAKRQSGYERRIAELEELLRKRESLITELVEENIGFKKTPVVCSRERMGRTQDKGRSGEILCKDADKSHLKISSVIQMSGINRVKFYDWRKRFGMENNHVSFSTSPIRARKSSLVNGLDIL